MDRRTISMWVVGALEALLILLLPMAMADTGSAMVLLLIVIPLLVLALGIVGGALRHPLWLHPLVVALATAASVMIFMNSSAWIYVPIFAAISFLGVFGAWSVRKLIADSRANQ